MKTKIYGHDPSKKVRNYQLEVNDAAVDLALNDPYLLLCRQESLELSCNKVKEGGYHIKTGKSHSKQLQSNCPIPKQPTTSSPPFTTYGPCISGLLHPSISFPSVTPQSSNSAHWPTLFSGLLHPSISFPTVTKWSSQFLCKASPVMPGTWWGAESGLADFYTKKYKKGCCYHGVSDSICVSHAELSLKATNLIALMPSERNPVTTLARCLYAMPLGALNSTGLSAWLNGLYLFRTGWYGAEIVLQLEIKLCNIENPTLEAIYAIWVKGCQKIRDVNF